MPIVLALTVDGEAHGYRTDTMGFDETRQDRLSCEKVDDGQKCRKPNNEQAQSDFY